MTLNEWAKYIGVWRKSKKFYTPSSICSEIERDYMLGKLMLVVTEVAEMAEAVRHVDGPNFEEELADTLIRLLDIGDSMGVDIDMAVGNKMVINEDRPKLHGKHTSL